MISKRCVKTYSLCSARMWTSSDTISNPWTQIHRLPNAISSELTVSGLHRTSKPHCNPGIDPSLALLWSKDCSFWSFPFFLLGVCLLVLRLTMSCLGSQLLTQIWLVAAGQDRQNETNAIGATSTVTGNKTVFSPSSCSHSLELPCSFLQC